jgi:hypothetical protein
MNVSPALLDLGRAVAALPRAAHALTIGEVLGLALPETDGLVLSVRAQHALLEEVYRNNTTPQERQAVCAALRAEARASAAHLTTHSGSIA